ncbi:ATP-dependent RNA helicase DHX33 [Centruroides vittatus]|uniref:ATP-dependent RNA helicase DHX33 n=1 Tax=Centruroides vittatus TaxID=120091 RepID=UPI003510AF81
MKPNTDKEMNNEAEDKTQIIFERKSLPIFSVRKKLIKEIIKHNCIIVIGETACGKTTQIPQYIYQSGIQKDLIIGITQPRRVAAITIAERVALERNTAVSNLVGYSVRFDDKTSLETKIKYMTDGMLLRESISDPLLERYSIIILDEAHERTIHTDVLFGVVKSAQRIREKKAMPILKVIIMSATMDVDHFSQYFNNSPVYYIEGRQYPVEIFYTVKPHEDYVFAALVTVFQIHRNEEEGDILVFCTGQEEIESMVRAVRETSLQLPSDCLQICPYPLYAALSSTKQVEVLKPPSKGCRKVIFSTNIAETSITIPGIKYVVDTGMVKAKTFNPLYNIELLKVQRISKAQAWQRTGRAGRQSKGVCYRLYTKDEYNAMNDHPIPEIQRCNLANVVLQLLAIGIRDILKFDFLNKPSEESVLNALNQLQFLGSIEDKVNPKLTDIGKKMVLFPLQPTFSKILIASQLFRCTEEILTIVSMLCVESVLDTTGEKEEFSEIHRKFESTEGDHIMMLNIFRAYKRVKGNKQWCHENRLNQRNLKSASAIRKQLAQICRKANMPFISAGQNTKIVRKCLTYGLFMNVAELQTEGGYLSVDTPRQPVAIHPSSCIFGMKPTYIMYTELVETSKCYMRNVSIVDPEWLVQASPKFYERKRLMKI